MASSMQNVRADMKCLRVGLVVLLFVRVGWGGAMVRTLSFLLSQWFEGEIMRDIILSGRDEREEPSA